jgi:hypothetical protein
MDACVCATSAQGGDFLGGEFFESLFQFVLDGEARALTLPALIGLTVVGNAQCDSHCIVFVDAGD